MTFTLDAVAEPLNVPPRIALTATESDADLSLQSVALFRDGVPLRFETVVTGDQAIAYDYDAPFDVPLLYRADGVELGSPVDWTEVWIDVAAWTGSGWAAAAGAVSSTTPAAVIHRDVSSGSIIQVVVDSPSNLTVQLTDSTDAVVVSVLVSPDGTVTLSGSASSKVTGSGDFTLSLSEDTAAIAGTGWSTSVGYSGVPTRVRLVAPQVTTLVWSAGSQGSGNGQFINPQGGAVDSTGHVWVADSGNGRLQELDSDGNYVSQFSTGGEPYGLAIDATDRLWVTDRTGHKVRVYNTAGVLQFTIGSTSGSADGQFNTPVAVAIKSNGNAVVVDQGNDRVQEFNSSGVFQSKFGSSGSGNGQFTTASSIAVDSTDDILVSDPPLRRVQRFNSAGTYQSQFGGAGDDEGEFGTIVASNGLNLAVDSTDAVWVVDYGNSRVQKFSSADAYQSQFPVGSAVRGGIAADGTNLILADQATARSVHEYTTLSGSTDDITTRIALDEPVEVTDDDTETLTGVEGAWLTNAAVPDLAVLIDGSDPASDDYFIVRSTAEQTSLPTNTVALEIEGSADVLTVATGPRKRETWTLDIGTATPTARRLLLAALANDAPISLRFPAGIYDGLDGGFYAVGDLSTARIGHPAHDHVTVVSLPLTPSRAPKFKPLWQWNMDALAQTGMSMDDVNAAFTSMNDLLVGPN